MDGNKFLVPFLVVILVVSGILFFQIPAHAADSGGNYIVAEANANGYQSGALTMITSGGVRSVIYTFAAGTSPLGVAIDGAGNYIVTENLAGAGPDKLSKITQGGVRTEIYSFPTSTYPVGVAIDDAGNYIVCEYSAYKLSMITPSGVRTVIYTFAVGTHPTFVAINGGNYIVASTLPSQGIDELSQITPSGVRTVIYTFAATTNPAGVAVDFSTGNYIVAEYQTPQALSMITPGGVRSVIYSFGSGSPEGVAIDNSGNYIVTEATSNKLSMITPSGVRSVIYSFKSNTNPVGVAIQPVYTAVIQAWDIQGWIIEPIYMDGVSTGYSTPHSFSLSGTHVFSVPDTDVNGYLFSSWDSGEITPTITVNSGGTHTAQYGLYSVTIQAWNPGGWIVEPITMDGTPTGFSTPHTFSISGSHTFSVPSTDTSGYLFSNWDTGEDTSTITVTSAGTHTAQYGLYAATIWAWDLSGWIAEPITMDGSATGFSTPHIFTGLAGTHTFTVPSTDVNGIPFSSWDSGETSTTLTVNSFGTHTAQYGSPAPTPAPTPVPTPTPAPTPIPPPLNVTITPSTWIMDVGQSKQFTATPNGGSGTYTGYQWYIGGIGQPGQTAQTFNYTPTSPGSPVITATVTDTSGHTSPIQTISPLVTVNPALIAPSATASPDTVDQGQPSTLSIAGLSGGTTPYSYQWLWKSPGSSYSAISGATSSTYVFSTSSFTATGNWSFMLQITDSASSPMTVNSSVTTVTVNSAPTVSLSPTSWVMDVGQSKTFTATASGGSGSYSAYQWYVSGIGQKGATSSTFIYTPLSIGSFSITATVNDSLGVFSPMSSPASVTVNSALSTPVVSPSSWTMDVGQTKLFSVSASGGTGTLHYQWYLDSGKVGSDSASYSYIASGTSHSIYCVVNDSANIPSQATSNTASVSANSALVAPVASASPGAVDQGQSSSLTASAVTTGTSPYTYQWYSNFGAASYTSVGGATSSSYNFATSSSTDVGSWGFILQVTDSAGASVNSTAASVTVNTPVSTPTPTPTVTAAPTVTATPAHTTITTPSSSPSPSPQTTPTTSPSASPSPTPTSSSNEAAGGTINLVLLLEVVAVISVVTIAVLAVLIKRKRK